MGHSSRAAHFRFMDTFGDAGQHPLHIQPLAAPPQPPRQLSAFAWPLMQASAPAAEQGSQAQNNPHHRHMEAILPQSSSDASRLHLPDDVKLRLWQKWQVQQQMQQALNGAPSFSQGFSSTLAFSGRSPPHNLPSPLNGLPYERVPSADVQRGSSFSFDVTQPEGSDGRGWIGGLPHSAGIPGHGLPNGRQSPLHNVLLGGHGAACSQQLHSLSEQGQQLGALQSTQSSDGWRPEQWPRQQLTPQWLQDARQAHEWGAWDAVQSSQPPHQPMTSAWSQAAAEQRRPGLQHLAASASDSGPSRTFRMLPGAHAINPAMQQQGFLNGAPLPGRPASAPSAQELMAASAVLASQWLPASHAPESHYSAALGSGWPPHSLQGWRAAMPEILPTPVQQPGLFFSAERLPADICACMRCVLRKCTMVHP
jgi:hypothetical protein